ncbi:MAG: MlaD family protein [Alphaproteobacteria bacterium]
MRHNLVETLIGAAVVAVATAFFFLAYQSAESTGFSGGYRLTAKVDNITGVGIGTDVRISGIKVGSVTGLQLDEDFLATVTLTIDNQYELSGDTSLSVASESLLGGSFIALQPGDPEGFGGLLRDGDQIEFATGTVDILKLIQQALFGTGGSSASAGAEDAGTDDLDGFDAEPEPSEAPELSEEPEVSDDEDKTASSEVQ